MNGRLAILIPVALAFVSACVTRGTEDARIMIVPANGLLVAADPNVSRDDNGFMRVVVQVSNKSFQNVDGNFAVEWFDAAHRPVTTGLSLLPRRITVPSRGWSFIDVISPNANVQDFRIRIEETPGSARYHPTYQLSRHIEEAHAHKVPRI